MSERIGVLSSCTHRGIGEARVGVVCVGWGSGEGSVFTNGPREEVHFPPETEDEVAALPSASDTNYYYE